MLHRTKTMRDMHQYITWGLLKLPAPLRAKVKRFSENSVFVCAFEA